MTSENQEKTPKKRGGVRRKGSRNLASERRKDKYSALDSKKNLLTRHEEIEDVNTYFNTLPPDAKEWMAKFMNEYNNASLDYVNLENNLHNTPELKKSCTDRNNARNRCIYTREKAQNSLNMEGDMKDFDLLTNGHDDDDLDVIGDEYE